MLDLNGVSHNPTAAAVAYFTVPIGGDFGKSALFVIPNYYEMVDALVSMVPFSKESKFSMIDLGCGTGTISKALKSSFPSIDITCVDVAGKMLETAKAKLNENVNCIQADFDTFEFPCRYNLVVPSLALHHLERDSDKLDFYKKIYRALFNGGIFINIDVVLGGNDTIQSVYMEKWKEFVCQNVPEDEFVNKWLPSYYAEDRPAQLTKHVDMLEKCGCSCVDVIYKYFNYAVYMGIK